MSEIVERLREYRMYNPRRDSSHHPICDEAADTITRLEAENERLRAALKRLTFMAETSGGTAGRDEELCAAIAEAKTLLTSEAENERLRAALEFVERWAVYKRYKPDGKNISAEEAIGIIAFHPAIRAITQRLEGSGEIDVEAYKRDRLAKKIDADTITRLGGEVDRLKVAISWIEPPFVTDSTPEWELRERINLCVADARLAALTQEPQP